MQEGNEIANSIYFVWQLILYISAFMWVSVEFILFFSLSHTHTLPHKYILFGTNTLNFRFTIFLYLSLCINPLDWNKIYTKNRWTKSLANYQVSFIHNFVLRKIKMKLHYSPPFLLSFFAFVQCMLPDN